MTEKNGRKKSGLPLGLNYQVSLHNNLHTRPFLLGTIYI